MNDQMGSEIVKNSVSASVNRKNRWRLVRDYALILAGSLVQALAMRLFLIPGLLVSGGVSGAAGFAAAGWG